MVREGEITSRELVEASLERIEALQPELNAFVHVDAEGALATADAVGPGDPRPFAGVPIAMKDTTPVAGMPFTYGSDLFGDFVPAHDSFVTRRIRDAGFVIVGKTNMPEFGILPVSEPRRFGPARNPWDTSRTPGGSSGGAAVRGGLRHGADRPRQRRRRLDPDPGRLLRPRRAEAHPRPRLARARAGRRLPRAGRRAQPHHRGDRGAPGRPGRLRGRRRHVGAAPGRAVRRRGRARARDAADRRDHRDADRGRARPDGRGRGDRGGRPARLPRPRGRGVRGALGRRRPAADLHGRLRDRHLHGDLLRRPAHRPRALRGPRGAAVVGDLEDHPGAGRDGLPARPHPAPGRVPRLDRR